MSCLAAKSALRPQVLPAQHQQPVRVQMEDGGYRRGAGASAIIDAAKLIAAIVFIAMFGTCVYVCGSAGSAKKSSSTISRPMHVG